MVRKFGATILLVACIVLVVAYIGRGMVKSSPIYEEARREVHERYGARLSDLSMPLLKPFQFSEGNSVGNAEFVLCDAERLCYDVRASKKADKWTLKVTRGETRE